MKPISRRDILRFAPLAMLSVSPFASAQRLVESLDVTPHDAAVKAAHLSTGGFVQAPPQYKLVTDGSELNWATDGTQEELWKKVEGFFGNMRGRYDRSYNEKNTDRLIANQVNAALGENEAYVLLQDNLRMFVGSRIRLPAVKAFVITPKTSTQILGVALIHNFCPPGGADTTTSSAKITIWPQCENDPSVTLFVPSGSPWTTDIKNAVEWYITNYLSQTSIVIPNDRKAFRVKIFLHEVPSAT